jgi:glycosyltransferase involved in cell wall biosynthesis
MPLVSVIIASYNRADFVRAAIDSVRAQSLADWELILVDDGSTDETFTTLCRAAADDRRILAYRQQNAGIGAARNYGAAQCAPESRYLFFLDDDDALEPDALARMSAYLEQHPDVGLLACQYQRIDAAGRKYGRAKRSRWKPSFFGIPRPLLAAERETPFVTFYCGTGQGPFAMYRRSVFERAGGWETSLCAHVDTDLFCRMALLGKVHSLSDRFYLSRQHGSNISLDPERVAAAFRSFREKWAAYVPRNPSEAAVLRDAENFYRTSFSPLRDIKVGLLTLAHFLRRPSTSKLRSALRLFHSGLTDLVQHRVRLR